MKFAKIEMTVTIILLLSLAISFVIVSNNESVFRDDIESKLAANIELKNAVAALKENCQGSNFDLNKSDFSYRKICAKSQNMQAELNFVRKKFEQMENELEGQFWTNVLMVAAMLFGVLLFLFKAIQWLVVEVKYVPIVVKVPRLAAQVI